MPAKPVGVLHNYLSLILTNTVQEKVRNWKSGESSYNALTPVIGVTIIRVASDRSIIEYNKEGIEQWLM